MSPSQTVGTSAAGRTRYWVIFFAVTLAILAYIDRVCISQAAPVISRDLGLSKQEMGWVFSAFALAYALFEIPGGWLSDWIGPKKVLIRIVLCWSAFTALTGAARGVISLVVIRFIFGAGEAGCFPALTKAFSAWLPVHERVRAQGIMWTFARWGGAFTPPLVILTFQYMDWRSAFVLYGALGLIWCWFFARWFRDDPMTHPGVGPGERELLKEVRGMSGGHGNVPWGKLVRSGSVWLLWLQYFCMAFAWYFYITWLPTYLQEFRHQSPADSAKLAIFPLLFGGFGSLAAGMLGARLALAMGVRQSRRLLSVAAFLGGATLIFLHTKVQDPLLAMMVLGLASFSNDLNMPGAWGACMDIGGKYAGSVAGSMNMMGNLAGFVAPVVGGYILTHTSNDWELFLYVMSGVNLIGALCWPFIDPATPLEE